MLKQATSPTEAFVGQSFIMGKQLHVKWLAAHESPELAESENCAILLVKRNAPRLFANHCQFLILHDS